MKITNFEELFEACEYLKEDYKINKIEKFIGRSFLIHDFGGNTHKISVRKHSVSGKLTYSIEINKSEPIFIFRLIERIIKKDED